MAYQVINTACTTPQQLMSEISNFVTKQAGFSDKGEFLKISPLNVNRSFLAPDGWYHNIEINPTGCTLMSNYSKNKPTGTIGNLSGSYATTLRQNTHLAYENAAALSASISFPLTSRHFFTNGKLVAIVIEARAGEFRHHIFGTLETYGDVGGGQWSAGSMLQTYTSNNDYYERFKPNTGSRSYLTTSSSSNDPYTGYTGACSPFTTDYGNSNTAYISSNGAKSSQMGLSQNQSVIRGSDDSLTAIYTQNWNDFFNGSKNYRAVLLPPYFNHYGANLYNGRSQIYPFLVYVELKKSTSIDQYNMSTVNLQPRYYSDMIGYCDVTHLEPATVVNNEWVVFPLSTKSNTMTNTLRSNGFGVAYRK